MPRPGSVPSPCRRVCTLDVQQRACTVCLRTLGEIVAWPAMDPARQLRLLADLARRAAGRDTPPAARGG
ncbi:MAG: DUF1289 domain-containing protein [Planctomycetes bacterium]|nr:DUF1289 domain-containing protein [Planctomycetota bacterium]